MFKFREDKNVCQKCFGFIMVQGNDPQIINDLCKCGSIYKYGWICPKCLEPTPGNQNVSTCGQRRTDFSHRINYVNDFLTEAKKAEVVVGYVSKEPGLIGGFLNLFRSK